MDIPVINMPIACSSNVLTSVALCCVIILPILEWPFIVTSTRHTCAFIMLYNLDEVDDLSLVALMFLLGWGVEKCRLYNWI